MLYAVVVCAKPRKLATPTRLRRPARQVPALHSLCFAAIAQTRPLPGNSFDNNQFAEPLAG
jgi:hypothetical protein